jgi:hypothetical protein
MGDACLLLCIQGVNPGWVDDAVHSWRWVTCIHTWGQYQGISGLEV